MGVTSDGAYRQHSLQHGFWPLVPEVPFQVLVHRSWYLIPGTLVQVPEVPVQVLTEEKNRSTIKMWSKRIYDEMLAMHCWISEGQSKCDEWGLARIHRRDPFSVHCRKEAAQNKERPDKTWHGVTFLWNLLPLSNGGKNMEYWRKPVGEKQGWGQPNYNGL